MSHKTRAIVRMTVKAVCLEVAIGLLLLREGEVFMAGAWRGVWGEIGKDGKGYSILVRKWSI